MLSCQKLLITAVVAISAVGLHVDATEPSPSDNVRLDDLNSPPPEPLPWVPETPAPVFSSPAARASVPETSLAAPMWQPPEGAYLSTPAPLVVAPEAYLAEWSVSSSWYLRADYFHWNERIDGYDLLNEDGVLTTLGYVRRIDRQRYLVELFGGDVHYSGSAMFDDGSIEPLSSHTEYLGARGEFDVRFPLDAWSEAYFVAGVGTRFWLRNLPNAQTASGDPVSGYQETWWTIYPYLGLEWARPIGGAEVYGSARIGVTAFTYEVATINDVTLYPAPGLTTQVEYGVRGSNLFLAGYLEVMGWGESPVSGGWLQPQSTMLTAGIKTGFVY